MTDAPVVRVSQLLDEGGIGAFQLKLLVWSLFIVLVDGYDIGALAFALPSLIKQWGVSAHAVGPVLSASMIGILFGSVLFGFVGDRYGRRAALLGANLLFGSFTLGAAFSSSLGAMFWLRLLAGVGLGGIMPNAVALNAESAPRRLRVTMALIAVGLVPIGGAIPGFLAAALLPHHGWRILFLVGGIVPLSIACLGFFGLPESIKFMILHERHHRDLEKLVRRIRPDFVIPPNARFVIEDEHNDAGARPADLFRGGLKAITPLLWLLFALNLMGYYFISGWMPTVLVTAAHLGPTVSSLSGAVLQVGGTVGALSLCRWIDNRGFAAIGLLFVLAVPVVGSVGWFGSTSEIGLLVAAFFTGFLVLGIQAGINVMGAMIYPTSLRSSGAGWALGMGRFGSIVGPLLGAVLVGLTVERLYLLAAVPFALGAAICFTIHRMNEARLKQTPLERGSQAALAQ